MQCMPVDVRPSSHKDQTGLGKLPLVVTVTQGRETATQSLHEYCGVVTEGEPMQSGMHAYLLGPPVHVC